MFYTPPENDLPSSLQLGQYTILRMLCQSVLGYTYLAHDNAEDKDVILEEYLPYELASRRQDTLMVEVFPKAQDAYDLGLKLFLEECDRLGRLQHPALEQVSKVIKALNTCYRITPVEEGKLLYQVIEERILGATEAFLLPLLHQLLEALQLLHEHGGLLGNITPEEILIRKDGTPVFTGFSALNALWRNVDFVSRYNRVKGSKGRTVSKESPSTDLYLLGGTFYRYVTGTTPALTEAWVDNPTPPQALTGRPELSQRYSEAFLSGIDKALSKAPEKRWQEAGDWAASLPDEATVPEQQGPISYVVWTEADNARALPALTPLSLRYTLLNILGDDGISNTYLARDDQQGTEVVIKESMPMQFAQRFQREIIAHSDSAAKEACALFRERMKTEARLLSLIRHPNIVPVIDTFDTNNTTYYVMPRLKGSTLGSSVKEHPEFRSEKHLLPILRKLLLVLQELHQLNIIHSDLKPENIFLTDEEEPVLLNFSAACTTLRPELRFIIESPGYTAIEQLKRGATPQPQADIYALAATFRHLITGEQPPSSMERYTGETSVRPLCQDKELHGDYSTAFLRSIDCAFEVQAEKRWETVQAWLDALPTESDASPDTSAPPHPEEAADNRTIFLG